MRKTLCRSAKPWWNGTYNGTIHRLPSGEIVRADALDFLASLKPESADLIFLDPPFNLGKVYGRASHKRDRLDNTEYATFMDRVLLECINILKPGGALFLYHIPKWAASFTYILGQHLQFRHWIAISMKNGFVRGNYLYPAHYALLYYSKGLPGHFRRPKTPLQRCRHCAGLIKDYGGYKQFVSDGVNLSDIWDDISPVRHIKYKHRRANELPYDIASRILSIAGFSGGILVDPFVGTGTSILAAITHDMSFVACDRDTASIKVAIRRVLASREFIKKGQS
ncbi:MAG: DNA methyltransferase [Acidobacteriota bacterium]|nr:DNA methyltransferase [Acidobacteriota bacterium]